MKTKFFISRTAFAMCALLLISPVLGEGRFAQSSNFVEEQYVPIYISRVVFIPNKNVPFATLLLGKKTFIRLRRDQVSELIQNNKITTRQMILQQITASMNEADRLRSILAISRSVSARQVLEQSLQSTDFFIDYSRHLSSELIPYLLDVPFKISGDGSLEIELRRDRLQMSYSMLGGNRITYGRFPVIVFCERKIVDFSVSHVTAE